MTNTLLLQELLDGVRAMPVEAKPVQARRCYAVADKYDLMRLEKDEIRKLPMADVRALIDYANEYIAMYTSQMSCKLMYRPANSVSYRYEAVEGKWMICETGNIIATPQVPMADFDETEAFLKIRDLLKVLTSELNRK